MSVEFPQREFSFSYSVSFFIFRLENLQFNETVVLDPRRSRRWIGCCSTWPAPTEWSLDSGNHLITQIPGPSLRTLFYCRSNAWFLFFWNTNKNSLEIDFTSSGRPSQLQLHCNTIGLSVMNCASPTPWSCPPQVRLIKWWVISTSNWNLFE